MNAPTPHSSTAAYIDWLVRRCRDQGDRARLRRTLRTGDTIDATAWWILGGWLSDDHDRALVRARIGGLYALCGADPGVPKRNLGGEMRQVDINETTAQRLLQIVTEPAAGTPVRVGHLARMLPRRPSGRAEIDWALLCDDLTGLAGTNPQWQRDIRSRWYRQYHNPTPSPRKDNP